MIGPDLIRVPSQDQAPKDGGGKYVSDFVSADTKIAKDGTVTGKLHHVEGVSSFPGQEEGWFFPVMLDSRYSGKSITCVGDNTKTSEDLDWLLRVDRVSKTFTFSTEEDGVILTLKFASVVLEPKGG